MRRAQPGEGMRAILTAIHTTVHTTVLRATFGAAAVCALAGAARADAPTPWMGVWQGSVGGAQVRACFGTRDQPDHGAYYYLRHLKLIRLDPAFASSGQAWSEGDAEHDSEGAPQWRLAGAPGGALTGTWTDKAGRSLPIRLTRVRLIKGDDVEEPCRGMTFMGPRIAPLTVTRTPAELDGTGYVRLIANVGAHFDVKIESFELTGPILGTTPAAARLNAGLAKPLPSSRPSSLASSLASSAGPGQELGRPDWLACLLDAAGSFGEDGQFEDIVEPGLISRRWLVTSETMNAACGDRQRSDSVDWRLFSLPSGEPVDPWSWFTTDAVQRSRVGSTRLTDIQPKLRKLLAARWSGEDECKDVARTENDWDIHPTREGLAFWPRLPHLMFPCAQDAVVPYGELAPLLNESGRAAIASIVEDLRSLLPPKGKP